jgi:hypothetical protein
MPRDLLALCPACRQVAKGESHGRVLLRGIFVRLHEDAVRRRIANVASRAAFTQPERQVVSVSDDGSGLVVDTTSQKLAHRLAHELRKAFGGRVQYHWADRDGSLLAIWQSDREVAAGGHAVAGDGANDRKKGARS